MFSFGVSALGFIVQGWGCSCSVVGLQERGRQEVGFLFWRFSLWTHCLILTLPKQAVSEVWAIASPDTNVEAPSRCLR